MSKAEREFVKWFIDRFHRAPVDNEAKSTPAEYHFDSSMREAFCNAYNLGVQHTEQSYSESVRRF